MPRYTVVGAALMLLLAASAQAEWYTESAHILEDPVQMQFWHGDAEFVPLCVRSVRDEMNRIHKIIDVNDPGSEISRINAHASAGPVSMDAELYGLIVKALRFGRVTRGAFDITFASVGFLYDYDKRVRPNQEQTERALQAVDYRLVKTNRRNRSVEFLKPGMKIDISGIAKGHAVDRAIKMLQACGATHALVSAGGDTRALSDHRGKPWVVEIRNPHAADKDVLVRIPLDDNAISTSGDYERAFEQDGERYHQIINPRTGDSPSDVRSVSVVGPDGIWCDALATGIFVLGIVEGMKVIESLEGYEAYIVDHYGGHHRTSGLKTGSDCNCN